jgi:hypothetical protein
MVGGAETIGALIEPILYRRRGIPLPFDLYEFMMLKD